jgi:DNA polymerase elongation subunit (family B)
MKILILDIETAPNTAYIWGMFKENIPLARLIETGYVLCWSAKWLGSDNIYFSSVKEKGTISMLTEIHTLLDEADAVIHFYGRRFDIPMLNREFLQYGFAPPSPYKQIDVHTACKSTFKFVSNKLEHVANFLGLKPKVKHEGFELWVKCMNDDKEAWEKMEEYNKGDVLTLEEVYNAMKPWIKNHPNFSAYNMALICPQCGSNHYQSRGTYETATCIYNRYQCSECKKWFRSTKNIGAKAGEKFVGVNV